MELLKGFFEFYGITHKSGKYRFDIKTGKAILKKENDDDFEYQYSLVDPFDLAHNPGNILKKNQENTYQVLRCMEKGIKYIEKGDVNGVFKVYNISPENSSSGH